MYSYNPAYAYNSISLCVRTLLPVYFELTSSIYAITYPFVTSSTIFVVVDHG